MSTRRGPIEAAVWGELAPGVRPSGLAQTALWTARRLDGGVDDRDAANLVRELRATLGEIRRLSPPKVAKDGIDDLGAKRAARRSSAG